MERSWNWIRRRALVLAVAALVVGAVGGTALAGHQTSNVKSYTGCLVSGDGVLIKIAEGNSPRSACTGGQVQAHFSGGDISKISVGSGLTLPSGGDNGEVRINLDPAFSLPQGCSNGQVAKWITSVSGWRCRDDEDTTYSAGTGLDLTGTTFSVEPDAFAKTDQACASGQFANGVNAGGSLACAAPTTAGIAVWQKDSGFSKVLLPAGEGKDVVVLPLPAGTFLVTATGTAADVDGTSNGDEEVSVGCSLRNGANDTLGGGSFVDIGEAVDDERGPSAEIVIHHVITFAAPDSVKFQCEAGDEEDGEEIRGPYVTAVRVGQLTTP
jgi:hypothetical protein